MKLKEWSQQQRGRQAAMAAHVGVSKPNVSFWASGTKSPTPKAAVAIEVFTGGEVTRRDLLPSDWGDIWPELITPEHPWPAQQSDDLSTATPTGQGDSQ